MTQVNARPLILIVEDHPDTRQMYAEFLDSSFEVMQAADGQEALAVLERSVPTVIVTDLSLPGLDGFELVGQIRANPATAHVPVICLSGHGGYAHDARARAAGFDRILLKPCLPDALALAVLEMAQRGRASST
jgi:two-component system, chemotaxis family, CheB/CheR fusion protein